jgi:hypothetical protein
MTVAPYVGGLGLHQRRRHKLDFACHVGFTSRYWFYLRLNEVGRLKKFVFSKFRHHSRLMFVVQGVAD